MDFREETIYFLLPARFNDGDPSNNRPTEWCSYPAAHIDDPEDVPWRGDFKGLVQRLDYIQDLGFTAIWITPIVHNRSPLDYHGYHPWDFERVDPRLESEDCTFQDLIDAVHAHGMKLIMDVVTNHSCRYGIKGKAEIKYNTDPNGEHYAADNPDWTYDGLTPNPADGKLWSRANLATLPAPYNETPAQYNWPNTVSYVTTSDPEWFHHSGSGFWEGTDELEDIQQRACSPELPDLNTGSPKVREYLINAYKRYLDMGVDAIRWDTVKYQSREDVLHFLDAFKGIKPDLFVFGEVTLRGHELHPVDELNPHWYTWRGQPGQSAPSGMSVFDFYLQSTFHHVFEEGCKLSSLTMADRYDHLYAQPTELVTWLDNHDFGPNNEWNCRFGGSAESLAACLNFMFTWRGIPCVYYGTEMQFMKGAYCDTYGFEDLSRSINTTGRAYYGHQFDEAVKHPLYAHIKKLNAIRKAIPALQKGSYQWAGAYPAEGLGYQRQHGDSLAVVGLAKDGPADFLFKGLPPGTYADAVTGHTIEVTDGRLAFEVADASAGIYVLNGPGKVGEAGAGFFQA